ncbi:ABC-ATPase domain-containing protein [Haloplasma contractile]|uniref:Glutamine transport system ATP-binding protein n=1 Tax=Haloplasma contractile SSD-17B TaxID=1033810 RepID=F7PTK0_9MOLU|nr:ABC-ATPase domain-containing protein [Haloplasma contractile]ERJ12159.1 putative glutamine transport system ATP-binding protein [Haloplasma contractile SSD-17B]
MKTDQQLKQILNRIDQKGYKAYKDIMGEYQFSDFKLSIDYVQGDPFASPSRIRVSVPNPQAGFVNQLYNTQYKRKAVVDFLSRTVAKNISKHYNRVGGSGKSGLLQIGYCGQELIERNYVIIDDEKVEARLEVGLPAAGRRVLGKNAINLFFKALPAIVKKSLFYESISEEKLINQVRLAEDQQFIRGEIENRNLVAFIANGSILPRESGVSQRPMSGNAIPFTSPKEYEIELVLPNHGKVKGMGIPEGVTLIVGGGFHGKSTILEALQLGVYDHIAGDGREYLITRENAVKIKAEDGRSVEKVNITPFINNLPMKLDTKQFSSENASGSTSQAANIMEALEIGTDLLLIDEDTSATNFMIRDRRMQQLVKKDKEPITPFIDKVRTLYEEQGVSTILVIGGSGDYFEVADHVIMMDEYIPKDVTEVAKEIMKDVTNPRKVEQSHSTLTEQSRVLLKSSFPSGKKGTKVKVRGRETISYNKMDIDLRNLEQLIDSNQTHAISYTLYFIMERVVNDKLTFKEVVDTVYEKLTKKGLDVVSPYRGHPGNMALPRKFEIAATLNRFRYLKIK